MIRHTVGLFLGLVVSAAVSYGMLLYALALGFDGPGSLTTTEAAKWIAMAVGTPLGGFVLGYLLIGKLLRARLAAILGMLPGLAVSMYLLILVVEQALSLARV